MGVTEDELRHLEDRTLWPDDIRARDESIDTLIVEVRRLRALIRAVSAKSIAETDWCPFCDTHHRGSFECPAVASTGDVK